MCNLGILHQNRFSLVLDLGVPTMSALKLSEGDVRGLDPHVPIKYWSTPANVQWAFWLSYNLLKETTLHTPKPLCKTT